jgi:hypothetical protein
MFDEDKSKRLGYAHWKCKCQRCGKEVSVAARNLKNGNSQSCGCNKARDRRDDLTGMTFGYLNVIEYDLEKSLKRKESYFKCLCTKCGTIKSINGRNLKFGIAKSCGCAKNELLSEYRRDDLTN